MLPAVAGRQATVAGPAGPVTPVSPASPVGPVGPAGYPPGDQLDHQLDHQLDDQPEVRETIAQRLAFEFMAFSPDTVARCVFDAWACADHLGLEVTPLVVERFARERLTGMVKSEPPSGRFPARKA